MAVLNKLDQRNYRRT